MSHPGYPNPLPVRAVVERLADAAANALHAFWPDEVSLLDSRVVDPRQGLAHRQVAARRCEGKGLGRDLRGGDSARVRAVVARLRALRARGGDLVRAGSEDREEVAGEGGLWRTMGAAITEGERR
jgi:hypothetical protein